MKEKVKILEKAPHFSWFRNSEKVQLSDYQGHWVIVFFYPKDLTPGCTQQACDFRDTFKTFEKKGVVLLGVSRDSSKRHESFKKKHDLPFELISDESGEICELYGVWKEKSMYGRKYMGIERSTFVIDPNGNLAHEFRAIKVPGHVEMLLKLF